MDQGDETICAKLVAAGEDVEGPAHEAAATAVAPVVGVDKDETALEVPDFGLDKLSRRRRLVHLALEALDLGRARLEGRADLNLDVVDDDEVGEEREDVLDRKVGRLEQLHRADERRARSSISRAPTASEANGRRTS
jgi:gamma-glutamylcysteine synthetase